jgi:type II secretory pathway component PulJ
MTRRMITTQRLAQSAGDSRIAGQCLGRSGVTLIETIVLITGVAAMLGLTVVMLQLLLKLDGDSRARFDRAGMLARLAEQFRRDVHGAAAARLVEEPSRPALLRIEQEPGRAIDYQVKGQSKVVRVESLRGKQVRTESYEVAQGGPIELALKQDGGHQFATLIVDRQVSKNRTDPSRLFEVLAQVGRNRDRRAATAAAAGGTP